MNKLPRIRGNVISDMAKSDIDVTAKDIVCTYVFKSDRVMVEVWADKDLDGLMVMVVRGKNENAIVNVSF